MKFYIPAQDVKDMFFPSQRVRESDKWAANNQCPLFSLFLKKMFLKGEAWVYYELQYKRLFIFHKDTQLSIVKYFMSKICMRADILITGKEKPFLTTAIKWMKAQWLKKKKSKQFM